ncbi:hypothetical protein ABPG72_015007 [Tetrahymena utriculariae]
MSEKSKRDLQYERKKKEREERLRRQREGDAGKEFPAEQQQFPPNNFNEIPPPQNNGFRGQAKKADNWEVNEGFQQQNNVNQNFAPQTQIKQDRNFVEPTRNFQQNNFGQDQMIPVQNNFHANQQQLQGQQEEGNMRNNKKQFIQAQVVNQAIEVQNANMQMSSQQNEGQLEKQALNDQKMQKQQYNNILQQQMAEKQIQQDRERQQKEMERQKMEEERKKQEIQKMQEQERERKEQYRLQLQEQMKMKEQSQQQQQFQNQQAIAPTFNQQQYNNQIPAQQFYGGMQFDNQPNNPNQKQEYRQFLMNQMQNKNQNNNQQVDKKALLQQQMEIQNSQSQGQNQMPVNRTNFARKNINNMYSQPAAMPSMNQVQNQEGMPLNQFNQPNQISQQRQPIQPTNYHHQQQNIASTPQLNQGFQDGLQNNSLQYNQQPQNIAGGQSFPSKQEGFQQNQSGFKQSNGDQVSVVRGNKNFMKMENADLGQVNRKQQQMLEYKRELEKQRQEQAMKKKQEEERKKREELEEEKRIQKEQEELKRKVDEEANQKKQQQENLQKENEQLREQKLKNKRQNDGFASNGSGVKHKAEENVVLPINLVSKQFLNDEKISEGIDPRASLMEFHRKKSNQNIAPGQGLMVQTPQNNVMTPISQQQQQQQNVFPNNMMQQPNPFMQQQMQQPPMMYGNQFMMGQFPPMPFAPQMAPMMMNPQLIQQQQFLAKQQADILPQLYELKLQMQQQQHQIDLIKSQANVAIDERNKAEQKYLELKKLYEQKQQEEKKYQQQLQDALSRYHPSNKPHQQLKKELDYITPTQGEKQEAPAKYQFHVDEIQTEAVKPFNNDLQNNKQKNQTFGNRLDSANQGAASQPQINVVKYQEPASFNINQQNSKSNNINSELGTLNNIPTNNNMELDSNPKQYDDNLLAEKAKKEYEFKMHQYGMKSLVSNNKFIPLDILDQVKDSQITMSKLGNYGVNGSQINVQQQNHVSAQNLNLNNNSGLARRPQSYNRSSNDLANKDNHLKYDIPSINSDIMKDIEKIMQKNNNMGDQFITQQSFYQQNPRQIKETSKINNENQNEGNSYNPQIGFNQNVYAQKPPSRVGSNQGMRRTGKEQNNPFGAAAKGILGDSKAFEQHKQQKQINQSNTFKTNVDQEGYNLGSDFPDFSINNKKGYSNGLGSKAKIEQNPSEANFQASELNFRASGMLKNDNNNITQNNNTYNTNNFDIEKINQRNEERLKKLNQFNINTVNNETHYNITNNNNQDQDVQDKLEFFLQKYNQNNNVQ